MADRQVFVGKSLTESTTTSTSDQSKVQVAWQPDANSDYAVIAIARGGSSSVAFDMRWKVTNTGGLTFGNQNVEPKATTNRFLCACLGFLSFGASPASQTTEMFYSSENAGATASIKHAIILIIKLTAADFTAESLGESSTNATYIDKASGTLNPASQGDYTFLQVTEFKNSSGGEESRMNLDIAGTDYCGLLVTARDDTNWRAGAACKAEHNLTTGNKTIKMECARGTSGTGTSTFRNSRILGLRHDEFDEAYGVFQGTGQNTTSASYADVSGASEAPTLSDGDYISFGGANYLQGHASFPGYQQLLEGATVLNELIETPVAATDMAPFLACNHDTYTAGALTWKFQHKRDTAGTFTSDELGIAIFLVAAAASGTEYEQNIDATAVGTGTIVKSAGKPISHQAVGTATKGTTSIAKTISRTAVGVATIVKAVTLGAFNATAEAVGTILTPATRPLTIDATAIGTATAATAIIYGALIEATAIGTATIVKAVNKTISRTATGSASIVKSAGKILAATAIGTGTILTPIIRALTINATAIGTATMNAVKAFGVVLDATALAVATVQKAVAKTISHSATGTGTVVKSVAKTFAATAVGTGTRVCQAAKNASAVVLAVVTVTPSAIYARAFDATAEAVATLNAAVTRALTLSATVTAVASTATSTIYAATIEATAQAVATISKQVGKQMNATALAVITQVRAVAKTISHSVVAVAIVNTAAALSMTISATVVGVASIVTQAIIITSAKVREVIIWALIPHPKDDD